MQRRALGKGLSALIPDTLVVPAERESTQEVARENEPTNDGARNLPLDAVRANPNQPRRFFDEGELMQLAESIRYHGVLQPIIVRAAGDGYEIIAGERRWRAAQRAGLKEIPAVVKGSDDREILEISLIENLQREDINPMEAASAYQRLSVEFGMTQLEIARQLGKSRPSIANTLRLLELPETVQRALTEAKISEGHARALLSLQDKEAVPSICNEITTRNLSVREVEQLVRKLNKGEPQDGSGRRSAESRKDPNLTAVENQLRERFQTKVSICPSVSPKGSGTIVVDYFSAEEFERIVAEALK